MIWIASYPRSGNTFVRNLLFHVYGIQSSEYHDEGSQLIYKDLQKYPFVKTHFLPGQLPKKWSSRPGIYIVRDGRDCTVSEAHYRQQLHGSEASYEFDLQRCITAKEGNHFGGWSTNVKQWLKKADVVLRFENLIKDPIAEMEKIRLIYDLPQPDLSNIPSFESQRQNAALYHGNQESSRGFEHIEDLPAKFYRKGEVNAWKSEMPSELQVMFWKLHGDMMEQMGYTLDGRLNEMNIVKNQVASDSKFAVMLDTTTTDVDRLGITKRYEDSLQKGLVHALRRGSLPFEFFLNGDQMDKLPVPHAYDAIDRDHVQKKSKVTAFTRNLFNAFLNSVRRLLDKNYLYFQRFCQVTGLKHIYQMITGRLAKIELDAHAQQYLTHQLSANSKVTNEKSLTTVHHSSPEIVFSEIFGKSNLISTSEQIKRELEASFPDHKCSHKVIYYGIDHEEFYPFMDTNYADILDQYGISHKQYLLLWSPTHPQEHLQNYLQASIRLVKQPDFQNHHVLVVGKQAGNPQHASVKHVEYIPQEHIASLFHGAALLCYTSHKGFGLPSLEAMRCKTIPMYGHNNTMNEVLGEHGVSADSDNVEDIYLKMKCILDDPQQRASMEKACYLKSWDFTLEKMTRQTLEVYQEFL